MFGAVGTVVGLLWLVGRSNPSGSENLGLDSRQIEERRTMLEIEDEEQVREALANLRSRRAAREAQSNSTPQQAQAD
jgi:hypothetical protein